MCSMLIGVTGSRGVLGRRIAHCLREHGHDVRVFEGDVRNRGEVRSWSDGLDQVVHCAALVPVTKVHSDPKQALEVNVLGSLNVAAAIDPKEKVHLTYISTSHVYKRRSGPIAESDLPEPGSLYGLTKLQGEQWVRALAPRHLVIRVFSFFAPDQSTDFLVPGLATRILAAPAGVSLDLASPESVRDLADADWVGRVCAKLVLSGQTGVVNCGAGRGYKVAEIADKLACALHRNDLKWNRTGRDEKDSLDSLVADTKRLRTILGQIPPFDFEQALKRFAAEIRERIGEHG